MSKEKMIWEFCEKYSQPTWIASRLMPDGVFNFIYTIIEVNQGKYIATACNNAYGANRIAVKSQSSKKVSDFGEHDGDFEFCVNLDGDIFTNLKQLKESIEDGTCLWLYTWYCNCEGEVTTEEY